MFLENKNPNLMIRKFNMPLLGMVMKSLDLDCRIQLRGNWWEVEMWSSKRIKPCEILTKQFSPKVQVMTSLSWYLFLHHYIDIEMKKMKLMSYQEMIVQMIYSHKRQLSMRSRGGSHFIRRICYPRLRGLLNSIILSLDISHLSTC